MKNILVIILFFVNSIAGYSQAVPWYRIWNSGRYSDGKIVVQTYDSGYAILAHIGLFSQGDECFFLVKYDCNGNFLFANLIADSIDEHRILYELQQTSDSGFIFAGSSEGPLLIRTDKFGNLIWQKKYQNIGYYATFYNVRQTSDKGYIACGSTFSYPPTSSLLVKTDSLGNKQWEKQITDSLINVNIDIVQDFSSNYYVSGYIYNSIDRYWGIVKKIDSNGNQIWSSIYAPNTGGMQIFYSGRNNIIIVGQNVISDYPTITKLDTSGNVKWVKNYTFPEFEYACMDKFNDIVICGDYAPGGYFPTIGLTKIDSSGNVKKSASVQYLGYDFIASTCIKSTYDIGYIICGEVTTRDSLYNVHPKVLLLKTDTAFNTPIITYIGNNSNGIINDFILEQNYPNPFNASTIIKFSLTNNEVLDINIYDVLGRNVFSHKQYFLKGNNEMKLDFSYFKLSSGLYFFRIRTKTNSKSIKILYLK